MTKSKLKNCIFLTTLLIISAIMFFGCQIKEVKAGPPTPTYIPEDPITNPNNNWHWDSDIQNGTEYIYETTLILQNKTSKEYIFYSKFYFIFNISISNQTYNWEGNQPCEFSIINATELYYDCTLDDTVPYDMDPAIIGGFQYNASAKEERMVVSDIITVPFFLPINTTLTADIDELANIIEESIYQAYYDYGMAEDGFGYINDWNSITFPGTNTMRFENTTDNYYAEFKYSNNGTLEKGDMYVEMLAGPTSIENLAFMNLSLNRIFDPNPINEVQWGVKEGDIIYYGDNYGDYIDYASYDDTYWNITAIVDATINDFEGINPSIALLADEAAYGTFQVVVVDCYIWDSLGEQYEFDNSYEYGVANEYMPYVADWGGLILPNNTKMEDLLFCTDQWITYYSQGVSEEEYSYSFVADSDYYKGDVLIGSDTFKWTAWYNKSTGLAYLLFFDYHDPWDPEDDWWEKMFIKENYTLSSDNTIELNTPLLNNINATVKITTTGADSDYVIALLSLNPINETLPSGTPLVYIDWLFTDISAITQLNITFTLPASLDLDNLNLQLCAWNEYECDWEYVTTDLSQFIQINYTTNSFTLTVPSSDIGELMEAIAAITYTQKVSGGGDDDDGGKGKKAAAIPGFDLYLLFAGIALFSLILIFERKRKLKF